MSKVTINDLYSGIRQSGIGMYKYKDVEIVPRRMVEMIIKRCQETIDNVCYTEDNARKWEAQDIKEFAESLLEEFEEE